MAYIYMRTFPIRFFIRIMFIASYKIKQLIIYCLLINVIVVILNILFVLNIKLIIRLIKFLFLVVYNNIIFIHSQLSNKINFPFSYNKRLKYNKFFININLIY